MSSQIIRLSEKTEGEQSESTPSQGLKLKDISVGLPASNNYSVASVSNLNEISQLSKDSGLVSVIDDKSVLPPVPMFDRDKTMGTILEESREEQTSINMSNLTNPNLNDQTNINQSMMTNKVNELVGFFDKTALDITDTSVVGKIRLSHDSKKRSQVI